MLSKLIEFLERVLTTTYGSEIEKYIVSNFPKNSGDIERLAFEYDKIQSRGKIL